MNREDIMPDKKNIKTADAEKKVVTKYDRKVQKKIGRASCRERV